MATIQDCIESIEEGLASFRADLESIKEQLATIKEPLASMRRRAFQETDVPILQVATVKAIAGKLGHLKLLMEVEQTHRTMTLWNYSKQLDDNDRRRAGLPEKYWRFVRNWSGVSEAL